MKTIDKFHNLPQIRTTGIGSLPHHHIDTALGFSFKMGLPFLPQIPIRSPWEFMLAQALEGLPGLKVEESGKLSLNISQWESQSHLLDARLKQAFSETSFESFEPSAMTSSCWQPFLWELQEKNLKLAKIQIAGPLTCQWALQLQGGLSIEHFPELGSQIFQLVLARSIAMTRRISSSGIQPILYLDEPGFYALSIHNPQHALALQELKWMIQMLRQGEALVGLHCCSDTENWNTVFELGFDLISIDAEISLKSAFAAQTESGSSLQSFIQKGGRLSLGVVPTSGRSSSELQTLDTRQISDDLLHLMDHQDSKLRRKILSEALFTPACGLALKSISDVELILDKLMEIYEQLSAQ